MTLLASHGFEKSKYVIEYSRTAAVETNFKVQHFGAVLAYASRAIADLERQQHSNEERERLLQLQAEASKAEEKSHALAEARLATMPREEYRARFEQAKAFIIQQYPNMGQLLANRQTSKLHEGAIRACMRQQLEREDMSSRLLSAPDPTEEN